MKMFSADYLAKDIVPFILHNLEKFTTVLADKIERKILIITLGKMTNI